MADYAATIIPMIAVLGFAEKMFWNCRDAEPASVCNPSLTDEDRSANEVLKALGGACRFSAGPSNIIRGSKAIQEGC